MEIDMDENEFEMDGVVYAAVKANNCTNCAFDDDPIGCANTPNCVADLRRDLRDVIFQVKP
jgi:hypothetical protein